MKNVIPTGPGQPFRCLEEATHVGCGCSETLFSGIAPARLDQQESQPGRQRHFCNLLDLQILLLLSGVSINFGY